MTRTNCQTNPAVKQSSSARTSRSLPWNDDANQGATIQASTPIGRAAAAQTAKIAAPRVLGDDDVGVDDRDGGDGRGLNAKCGHGVDPSSGVDGVSVMRAPCASALAPP